MADAETATLESGLDRALTDFIPMAYRLNSLCRASER